MNLKNLKISLPFVGFALILQQVQAGPLVTIGDIGTVSFTGQSMIKWDDNIFRQEAAEVDDQILMFSPGFSATFGRNASDLDFGVNSSYDFVRYQDKSDLDTELLHVGTDAAYQTGRIVATALFSYDESKSNDNRTNVAGDLVEREVEKIKLNAEYTLSPKFSVELGLNKENLAYVGTFASFSNRDYTRIPLNVYYELTPKLDLSFGYVRGEIDVEENGKDAETDTFNIGLRGELLPKLTGNLKVGIVEYENDSGSRDDTTLSVNADVNWVVSSKVTHRLDLRREFDASATGTGTRETKARWSSTYVLNSKTLLSGRLSYSMRDYLSSDRDDKLTTLGLNGSYRLGNHWNLNAGYVLSKNNSNQTDLSYDDTIVTFSAVLTY